MSEVKTPDVAAKEVQDANTGPPGCIEYFFAHDRVIGMIYQCPCGCGQVGALRFRPAEAPSWEWNGRTEAPTLQPSVHHVGHWHGWLTDGVWKSC